MIEHLAIERFKSILSLAIPCRKVNVFIGAPDTGKTNILEALYLLSRLGWGLPLDSSLRLSGGERHLIVVKPDLERCFRRSVEFLGLESQLPTRPEDLRRVLGVPGRSVHARFQAELRALYQASVRRGTVAW